MVWREDHGDGERRRHEIGRRRARWRGSRNDERRGGATPDEDVFGRRRHHDGPARPRHLIPACLDRQARSPGKEM
jgi:hypothetical protein